MGTPTLIVGAGEAGSLLLRSMIDHPERRGRVVAFVDDDPKKHGLRLLGVRVEGGREAIPEVVARLRVKRILIAVPSVGNGDLRDIVELCLSTGCEVLKASSEDLLETQSVRGVFALQTALRVAAIQPEDLLGRVPVPVDSTAAQEYLTDRVVLITGGAGSIGSELANQVAPYRPSRLVVYDMNETASHQLSLDLRQRYPELDFTVVIGSIRDEDKLNATFVRYRPDVVFHAAAHKHVPLMEHDPEEAVKNNVLGTYHTAVAAAAHGVGRFILISTDKAVNPTNVMGASKRMCEFIVKGMSDTSERIRTLSPKAHATRFAAVRFGNVLGSNGSVIPLFKRQIEQGGPVTVTHPEMTRYFMTIPEAARLVIEAGSMARGGEIFLLDMGTPVRIDELARRMIQMSGLTVGQDIHIEYVGLRPGEKLYEELRQDCEESRTTRHPKISCCSDAGVTRESLESSLHLLHEALLGGRDIRSALRRAVPTLLPDRSDPGADE